MRSFSCVFFLALVPLACSSSGGGGSATVTGCPADGWLGPGKVGDMAHWDCASNLQGFGCYCDASGRWLYSEGNPCDSNPTCPPATCIYQGQAHMPGEVFSAGDGCNTCMCSGLGDGYACTAIACMDAGPTDAAAD
jgi:hypothetical protein